MLSCPCCSCSSRTVPWVHRRPLYEKRMSQEIDGELLGPDYKVGLRVHDVDDNDDDDDDVDGNGDHDDDP